MAIKAKQLKQLLSRLADETDITGLVMTFVDNPAAATITEEKEASFNLDGMVLQDISIKAESSASISSLNGHRHHHCGHPCVPLPPRPYFIY